MTATSPSPLISIVDPGLPDRAFRILSLIRACSFEKPCSLAFEEIGQALNCSERQTIRHIGLLERGKYITVKRLRNRRNVYSVPAIVKQKSEVRFCSRCARRAKAVAVTGLCRTCTDMAALAERVRWAQSELGATATPEEIAAYLKNAHLARRIRRILERGGMMHERTVVEPASQFAAKEAS